MAGLQVGVNVDDRQVRDLLARAPEALQVRLRQLVAGGAVDVQREMRLVAPVAVTGSLRGSVSYTIGNDGLTATVAPTSPYADDVEGGTKPHMVSVAPGTPLRQWADQKGINPWALKYSIAAKGTKAHPFVAPTYSKMEPIVRNSMKAGIRSFVSEFNRGDV